MAKEDMVHIYNGVSLSHKEEQNNACAAAWADLETAMRVRSGGRERRASQVLLMCGIYTTLVQYLLTEWNGVTDVESNLGVPERNGGGGTQWAAVADTDRCVWETLIGTHCHSAADSTQTLWGSIQEKSLKEGLYLSLMHSAVPRN